MTLPGNPFAVLGVPARPDLDDETVRAAWRQIAAATHPDRADGGDLARYTQATAAFAELRTPWGRSEAYADLPEQAWAAGRFVDHPGFGPAGAEPLPAVPVAAVLQPVPPREVLLLLARFPARIRRGHPRRLLLRAAVIAGLCLAVLAEFPRRAAASFTVAVLTGYFLLSARQDLAPARALTENNKNASGGASGSRMGRARPRGFGP